MARLSLRDAHPCTHPPSDSLRGAHLLSGCDGPVGREPAAALPGTPPHFPALTHADSFSASFASADAPTAAGLHAHSPGMFAGGVDSSRGGGGGMGGSYSDALERSACAGSPTARSITGGGIAWDATARSEVGSFDEHGRESPVLDAGDQSAFSPDGARDGSGCCAIGVGPMGASSGDGAMGHGDAVGGGDFCGLSPAFLPDYFHESGCLSEASISSRRLNDHVTLSGHSHGDQLLSDPRETDPTTTHELATPAMATPAASLLGDLEGRLGGGGWYPCFLCALQCREGEAIVSRALAFAEAFEHTPPVTGLGSNPGYGMVQAR